MCSSEGSTSLQSLTSRNWLAFPYCHTTINDLNAAWWHTNPDDSVKPLYRHHLLAMKPPEISVFQQEGKVMNFIQCRVLTSGLLPMSHTWSETEGETEVYILYIHQWGRVNVFLVCSSVCSHVCHHLLWMWPRGLIVNCLFHINKSF